MHNFSGYIQHMLTTNILQDDHYQVGTNREWLLYGLQTRRNLERVSDSNFPSQPFKSMEILLGP